MNDFTERRRRVFPWKTVVILRRSLTICHTNLAVAYPACLSLSLSLVDSMTMMPDKVVNRERESV
jgi:hypothetical protein